MAEGEEPRFNILHLRFPVDRLVSINFAVYNSFNSQLCLISRHNSLPIRKIELHYLHRPDDDVAVVLPAGLQPLFTTTATLLSHLNPVQFEKHGF